MVSKRGWDRIRFGFALVAGALILVAIPSDIARAIVSALDSSAFSRANHAIADRRTWAEGPSVVWVRFDDASIGGRPVAYVPRPSIAAVLRRVRTAPGPKPAIVFLDLALGESLVPADRGLEEELAQWRGAATPLLAVHAGRSCEPPPDEAGRQAGGTVYFDPPYSAAIPRPGSPAAPQSRISWACPAFDGFDQAEYSCVTMRGRPPTDLAEKFALPSPAWLAAAANRSRRANATDLAASLDAATEDCRGTREVAQLRPYRGRVNLAYREDEGLDGLRRPLPAGGALLHELSARSVAMDGDLSPIADSILVIGASNSWTPDRIATAEGDIPGSILVGFAMREAWLFGLDREPPAFGRLLLFAALLTAFKLVANRLRIWRPRAMAGWRGPKLFWFLLLQEKTAVIAMVALAYWLSAWFPVGLIFALLVAVVIAGLLFVSDTLSEDWYREKMALG